MKQNKRFGKNLALSLRMVAQVSATPYAQLHVKSASGSNVFFDTGWILNMPDFLYQIAPKVGSLGVAVPVGIMLQ